MSLDDNIPVPESNHEGDHLTPESVSAEDINKTIWVSTDDDAQTKVNNLSRNDIVVFETGEHRVSSTLTFSTGVTMVWNGKLVPEGDFTAMELNHDGNRYHIIPRGGYGYVVHDVDDVSTSSTSHGVEIHAGYHMFGRGMVQGVGGIGVYNHQAQSGDFLNHSHLNWLAHTTGEQGFKNENSTADVDDVNSYTGRVHVFNPGNHAIHFADGFRMQWLDCKATGGNAGINSLRSLGNGQNWFTLEEEGYGQSFTIDGDQYLLVTNTDQKDTGWAHGNASQPYSRQGGGDLGIIGAQGSQYYGVNPSGGGASVTLPGDLETGTMVVVKDEEGAAGSNTITIDVENSGTIDGSSTAVSISTDYGYRRIVKAKPGSPTDYVEVGSN